MSQSAVALAVTRRPLRRRAPRGMGVRLVVSDAMLPTAFVLWLLSVDRVRVAAMGRLGLVSVLPATFFAAVGLVVLSAVSLLLAPRASPTRLGVHLVTLAVMLYGTAPLVYSEPRYSWLYKHLGVVEFIQTHHHLERHIDIFHNWPGFFALVAFVTRLAGISDPLVLAAWAQLFFNLLYVLMLSFAVRALAMSWRERWLALFVFSSANWVAQDYFSPQATAFALSLGTTAIALHWCRVDPAPAWWRSASSRVRSVLRIGEPIRWNADASAGHRARASPAAVVAILLAQAALTVMHELSPYVVALQLGLLTLLGRLRPRWLAVALVAVPVAYLLPRLAYVDRTYGLLDSLGSFFSNARPPSATGLHLAAEQLLVARATRALSGLVLVLAVAGVWRRLREGRPVLVLAALAFSPALLLVLQSYGGEALLRVELFSLPWSACLASSAIVPRVRRWRGASARGGLLCAVTLMVIVALFLPSYFGNDRINRQSSGAVAASRYLYSHGASGAVVYLDKNFPVSSGGRYHLFYPTIFLLEEARHRGVPLRAADVPSITNLAREVATSTRRPYLVLSEGMLEYARSYGLTRSKTLRPLERALDRSPDWRVFYRNADTTIYQLR